MLAREPEAEPAFDELWVRSETGLGAEAGTGLTLTGRSDGTREAGRGWRDGDGAAPVGGSRAGRARDGAPLRDVRSAP